MAQTLTGATIASTYKTLLKAGTQSGGSVALSSGSTTERLVFGEDDAADVRTSIYVSQDRVGIGTATPLTDLHINNSDGATLRLTRSAEAGNDEIIFAISGGSEEAGTGDIDMGGINLRQDGGVEKSQLHFLTQENDTDNAVIRMVIDSDGNVGIGDTTPDSPLYVIGDNASGYAAKFVNDGNDANRYGIAIYCGEDTPAASTADECRYMQFYDGDGNVAMGGIYNSTNIDLPQFFETSDARVKDGIKDTNVNALSILNNLKMREFTKKGYEGECKIGLVAQEVLDVLPELVSKTSTIGNNWKEFIDDSMVDKDGNKQMYTIGTGILPYYFIKAIQELSAKVTALENA